MYIKRSLEPWVTKRAKEYAVLAILGPRQSGKTTLAQQVFKNHIYINLEKPQIREFAISDPEGFLNSNKNKYGIILDEVQNAPQLLSYIQVLVDENRIPGYFILTGSQNFLIRDSISQSLAGRVAILTLLPFSIEELTKANQLEENLETQIYKGFYPPIYAHKLEIDNWYSNYIETYVEKDVRKIENIDKISEFQNFIKLCAGRVGQLLNLSSLSIDAGVSVATIKSWLSILEASYIIFILRPYHNNFSKRLIKSPKIFFYDTGLLCRLLEIENPKQLYMHYYKGNIFESMIISDILKQGFNKNKRPNIYFFRDNHGNEVDCIIEKALEVTAIEIKSSRTIQSEFFKGIKYWNELNKKGNSYLIYAGEENQKRTAAEVLSWKYIYKIES
jgi:uncharacterized protein